MCKLFFTNIELGTHTTWLHELQQTRLHVTV